MYEKEVLLTGRSPNQNNPAAPGKYDKGKGRGGGKKGDPGEGKGNDQSQRPIKHEAARKGPMEAENLQKVPTDRKVKPRSRATTSITEIHAEMETNVASTIAKSPTRRKENLGDQSRELVERQRLAIPLQQESLLLEELEKLDIAMPFSTGSAQTAATASSFTFLKRRLRRKQQQWQQKRHPLHRR